MRKILLILPFLFICPAMFCVTLQDSLSHRLYILLENKSIYSKEKEDNILELKKMFSLPNLSDEQRYDINRRLYEEYKVYIADSAMYYMRQNLHIAEKLHESNDIIECKLNLAHQYTLGGMYIEALQIIERLSSQEYPKHLKIKYFETFKMLYEHYSYDNIYADEYVQKSRLLRDSLLQMLSPESSRYKILKAEFLADRDSLNAAKDILKNALDEIEGETHDRAITACVLANIYKMEGDLEQQQKYYTISAISDIKNSIKENTSQQLLAEVLYKIGDINHAYLCIKSSMEDATFCNARIRTSEVSKIFPIIDSAYQHELTLQKDKLKLFLVLVSVLSLFLITIIAYVYMQMKRVARIRKELYHTNLKLNNLNYDLQNSNLKLNDLNLELSDANRIKETYIAHFLDLCSLYIDKLEKFQTTLNKKASEKKLDELYKIIKSNSMIEDEVKALFVNFDNIFLHLYPNFVEDFNKLLVEKERFVLKSGELLNPEIRIFALIRLGITDSSRIAKFLRYSATTVYNYRTRVKNKAAVPREDFEKYIMQIGNIS